MWQDVSIFLKRQGRMRMFGGNRSANNSLSNKKQSLGFKPSFKLARNNFKQKKQLFINENFDLKNEKQDQTNQYISYISPNYHIPRASRYKICNSKNVCVFLKPKNLKSQLHPSQIEIPEKRNQINFNGAQKNAKIIGNSKNSNKKIRQSWLSQTQSTTTNFKLRKVASSLSYRQKNKLHQKSFDPWHNDDNQQDPDIIFYK